ncbi:MAG: VCBS repeat-containing protein [Ignavibacteria bacterium]|nr:VCBS repeat-containing protein [Ignavibacteria bacterium]
MKTMYVLLFSAIFNLTKIANSQPVFTQITSPGNPAVTDAFESTGACWIDFNNDGYLDLFVSNGNLTSQNNSLYLNNRSGGFVKITTGPVVNDGGSSIGGTWGDYNNDGNPDLFVANRNNFGNFLYLGSGDTTFTKITTGNIVTDIFNSNSSHWIDINKDGLVDLHVINFQQNDILYINNGNPDFTFTKIDTSQFLLDGSAFSIVGCWGDVNNDRQTDLFMGNAGSQNDLLYINNGNQTFTKTTFNDARNTLGCSWGDFDNDGDLDLFTSGFLNQRSRLYVNSGSPDFLLVPVDTGIVSNEASNSVGSCWGDFDNDRDLDLFVANDGSNNFLYLNTGSPNYGFVKVTNGSIVSDGGNSFGCAAGDYDNDGQLDIYVANRLNQQNFLYHNNGNSNNWITIKCSGVTSNKAAIGTKIRVKAGGVWQMQEVVAQTGYNSQNLWLHFGLGNAAVIDSVRVEWINGMTHSFVNQPVNRNVTISESGTITGLILNSIQNPDNLALYQNYPNPFNPVTKLEFGVTKPGFVSLKIYDALGKEVSTLVNESLNPGIYKFEFDASGLMSGIYFYTLKADGLSETKKMMLIK